MRSLPLSPHFADEGPRFRGTVACPRPHSQLMAELGPAPSLPGRRAPAVLHKGTLGMLALVHARPHPMGTQQACIPRACPSKHSLLLSLGRRCEICDDGFFGDPLGLSGDPQPCQQCQCSGNVDPNAVGNCDPLSGHCLRCLYNTTGAHCDHCQEGFYGSVLAPRLADRCMREYPLPGPTGWGCWVPSPPDQPAALRGCAP